MLPNRDNVQYDGCAENAGPGNAGPTTCAENAGIVSVIGYVVSERNVLINKTVDGVMRHRSQA